MEKREIRKDCFGYVAGKKDCQILTENVCLTRKCSFFKTREQFYKDAHLYDALSKNSGSSVKRHTGKKRVRCSDTGVVFASIRKAAEVMGVHVSAVSAVCHGKQKRAGGYHFEFVD